MPDFDPPRALVEYAKTAMDGERCNQYGEDEMLLEGAARCHALAGGCAYDAGEGEVVATVGQTEALALALLAVVNPGDGVVVFEPVFETYVPLVEAAGGLALRVPLRDATVEGRRTCVDEEALVNTALETRRPGGPNRIAAVIVNSPHNPTGLVFNDEDCEAVAKFCLSHDAWAVLDSVYEHFVYTTSARRSLALYDGMRERTIVTSSASKVLAVTGWRVGWAFGPPHVIAVLQKMQVKVTDTVPRPFQRAIGRFLTEPGVLETHLEELREFYAANRRRTVDMLRNAGFAVHDDNPEGGIFVWASAAQSAMPSDVLCTKLVTDARVSACPGSNFFAGPEHSPFLRFAFCKSSPTLQQAQDNLEKAIATRAFQL